MEPLDSPHHRAVIPSSHVGANSPRISRNRVRTRPPRSFSQRARIRLTSCLQPVSLKRDTEFARRRSASSILRSSGTKSSTSRANSSASARTSCSHSTCSNSASSSRVSAPGLGTALPDGEFCPESGGNSGNSASSAAAAVGGRPRSAANRSGINSIPQNPSRIAPTPGQNTKPELRRDAPSRSTVRITR